MKSLTYFLILPVLVVAFGIALRVKNAKARGSSLRYDIDELLQDE